MTDYSKVDTEGHFHSDSRGIIHKCYHKCRTQVLTFGFWAGLTIGFPIEHFIWEKLPGFSTITRLMHL